MVTVLVCLMPPFLAGFLFFSKIAQHDSRIKPSISKDFWEFCVSNIAYLGVFDWQTTIFGFFDIWTLVFLTLCFAHLLGYFFNLNFWKLEIRRLSQQEKAASKPICNALIAYSATRDFGPFKQFLVLTWIVAMRGFSLAQDSLYTDRAAIPIWGLDDGSCI